MNAVSVKCEPTPGVDGPEIRRAVPADPCVMVIFGAAGDLTRADLLPSLYELHRKQLLPEARAEQRAERPAERQREAAHRAEQDE